MVDQIQGTGSMMGPRGQFNSQPLTEDQKTQIQTILSQYDPKNVTAEDAKSIFQAFRDAGIKPARGMKEVIETAGFDADALREMARPLSGRSNCVDVIRMAVALDHDILFIAHADFLSDTD